jgi:hypothetical protein
VGALPLAKGEICQRHQDWEQDSRVNPTPEQMWLMEKSNNQLLISLRGRARKPQKLVA